jgi:hypothetical protein
MKGHDCILSLLQVQNGTTPNQESECRLEKKYTHLKLLKTFLCSYVHVFM